MPSGWFPLSRAHRPRSSRRFRLSRKPAWRRSVAERAAQAPQQEAREPGRLRRLVQVAGPGLITGGADNDPSGIGTYSTVGATTGLSQLWLLIISIPLLIAVQGIAARLGNV